MNARTILWGFFVALGLTALALAVPVARAEPPLPGGLPWGMGTPWPTASPLTLGKAWSGSDTMPRAAPLPSVPVPTPMALPAQNVPTSAPETSAGASPLDALEPTGAVRTLDAGASVWYRIGQGGAHIEVWLAPEPAWGVQMEVYAPGQLHRPIGRGTAYKGDPTRLVWSGGHWQAQGTWYARVVNGNPSAIRYTLTRAQFSLGNKSCYSYWEMIGTLPVYWTECR